MTDAEQNPYESPRAAAEPDELPGPNRACRPPPEQKRRWRRAVVPCVLFSLAAGFCASFYTDAGIEGGLTISALATPAIVAHWLILASTGRRRLANVVFALWFAGWLAPCGYYWVLYQFQFEHSDHPVAETAQEVALILVVSHVAAYGGIRIGMRR